MKVYTVHEWVVHEHYHLKKMFLDEMAAEAFLSATLEKEVESSAPVDFLDLIVWESHDGKELTQISSRSIDVRDAQEAHDRTLVSWIDEEPDTRQDAVEVGYEHLYRVPKGWTLKGH